MRKLHRFELSATQLLATALAAITATVAASYLGVAGTVIGAAVASVVSAVGNAVYGHSLRSTQARVRDVVPARRRPPAAAAPEEVPARRRPPAAAAPEEAPVFLAGGRSAASAATTSPENVIDSGGRARWRAAAFGAVATFAALLAVVTGLEIVAGRPVSDLVRGDSGSGTTLFGAPRRGTAPVPAPTVTTTVTPSVVVVTPTVTQTAPPVTRTATAPATPTPSSTPTAPATPSTSGQPTG
jgi:hypothetical protein